MKHPEIYNAAQLSAFIQEVGFLPLLDSGIPGFAAEQIVADDCGYVVFPDGGWDWPLWKWKGPIVSEGGCLYGKFFGGKAGFISREWWPDFCNFRRSQQQHAMPEEGSIEETILLTLATQGSLITRELRAACGFNGPKMRSRFDSYVTRLQMATRIVTQDFVYPTDKHGREYGWGWALLTTPEQLVGREACQCDRTPQESIWRMTEHLMAFLPDLPKLQVARIFIK